MAAVEAGAAEAAAAEARTAQAMDARTALQAGPAAEAAERDVDVAAAPGAP